MTARIARFLPPLAAALLAGTLLAGPALAELPNLPAEVQLRRGADSPGVVTFRHESHVDTARPACLTCHPRRFSIMRVAATDAPRRPAVTHAAMEQGQACGACHGKAAFGFDDCTMCHAK